MTTYSNLALKDAALAGQRVAFTMNLGGPAASIEGYIVAIEERDILLAMTVVKKTTLPTPILTIVSRDSILLTAINPEPTLSEESEVVRDFVTEYQQVGPHTFRQAPSIADYRRD